MAKKKKAPAITRTQAREIDKKFTAATKVLSSYMHNTGHVTDDLLGYKVPAGTFTDKHNIQWQIQAHAVCSKKKMMKKDEVVPMIRTWAIGLKFRAIVKYVIDWAGNN